MFPKLRDPLVLVHGLFGFDRLRIAGMTLSNYFAGIPEQLEASGNRVLIPSLSPTGGIKERARQLQAFLQKEVPDQKVHIIAHSMGGLDARYMISRMGMEEGVLSLTTLGTPHRGSAFADWSISRLERIVKPVMQFLSIPTQGFYDLTRAGCKKFNDHVPDMRGVRYYSVAGKHNGHFLTPEWLLPYHIVLAAEGDNDGVVSIESATWGEGVDVWDGDHFSLVNWLHPLDRTRGAWAELGPRYAALLGRLAEEGFAAIK